MMLVIFWRKDMEEEEEGDAGEHAEKKSKRKKKRKGASALNGNGLRSCSNLIREDQQLLDCRMIAGNLVGMEIPQESIDILHGLVLNIGQLLDLAGNGLQVIIGQGQAKLLSTVLDSVPTSETMSDRDIAGHTEDLGLQDLIGGGVVQDGLGVDTGLVGEGAVAGDTVVERDLDLDGVGDEVLEVAELVELVLGGDVVGVDGEHAGDEVSNGGDAVALADAQDGSVDVCCAGFQCCVCICRCTSRI